MITLVIEDGTGIVDANSYISLEDANAYHAERLYTEVWEDADEDEQARALIMATSLIESHFAWRGFRKSTTQALGWPRTSAVNGITILGRNTYHADDLVPKVLAEATAEFALALLTSNRTAEPETQGISSIGLGQGALSLSFDAEDRQRLIPAIVKTMLAGIGAEISDRQGGFRMVPVRRA